MGHQMISSKEGLFFPGNTNDAWPTKMTDSENVKEASRFIFRLCYSPLDPEAMKAVHISKSFYIDWNSHKFEMAQKYQIQPAWMLFVGFDHLNWKAEFRIQVLSTQSAFFHIHIRLFVFISGYTDIDIGMLVIGVYKYVCTIHRVFVAFLFLKRDHYLS